MALSKDVLRPIIGIENRTAQEVFDIMCDRFRVALSLPAQEPVAWVHPELGWTSQHFHEVKMHCQKDGPGPVPLYASPQPEAVITDVIKSARNLMWMLVADGDPPTLLTPYGIDANDFANAYSELSAALLPTHKPLQEEG